MRSFAVGCLGWLLASSGAGSVAQAPLPSTPAPRTDTSIDDEAIEQRILQACAALRTSGRLVAAKELADQMTTAASVVRTLPAEHKNVVSGPDLHDLAQASCRMVGHYYLCRECDEWHFTAASGFCLDGEGAVATCAHVVAPDDGMRASFLVTADLHGAVWPVEKVLVAAVANDVCVLQTSERGAVGLPLRGLVRTGERVYCLSHPDHQFGFFSEGLLARQFLARAQVEAPKSAEPKPGAPAAAAKPEAKGPALPWLHVTCDFCKGSSGAPILDAMGNVVGVAQSTTTVLYDEAAVPVDTQMVFKTATPAAALLAMVRAPAAADVTPRKR